MVIETSCDAKSIIDWDLGAKLAGNRLDLAQDLLRLLIKNLRADFQTIEAATTYSHTQDLLKFVHKLHGAASYCGVPRLKKILSQFEAAIKKNESSLLESYVADLAFEIDQVIRAASQMEIRE